MGLFGFGKKKQQQQPQAPQQQTPQFQVGKTEVVPSIEGAKMVSGSKYFQDAMRSLQGDCVQVAIIEREKTSLKYDDYAVVLQDMTPVGTLSQYGLDKLNISCGEVVTAIIQRPQSADGEIRLWIPIAK